MLSKSRPTNAPPRVINGTKASANALSEYVEMCSATATSSHGGGHEVVAEADLRGEADGVQHAVDAAPLLGHGLAHVDEVLGT